MFSVAEPSNTQNDRVYVGYHWKHRRNVLHRKFGTSLAYTSDVQRDRHNVCRSLKTRQYRVVVFCRAGVKINGAYYREVLLTQKLLPIIRQISGNEFVFQEDIASASRARETIELLRRETPDFISPSAARRGNKHLLFSPRLYKKRQLCTAEFWSSDGHHDGLAERRTCRRSDATRFFGVSSREFKNI